MARRHGKASWQGVMAAIVLKMLECEYIENALI
jgi:hypothetical protein